jgi:hypothetical protein
VQVKSNSQFSRKSKGFAPIFHSNVHIKISQKQAHRREGGLSCPAIGAECNYCHKKNHFISVCRKRQNKVKLIDNEQSDSQVLSEANTADDGTNECDVLFGLQMSDR